ncbi:MAG: type VI secretion system protein TssA [bacterium]
MSSLNSLLNFDDLLRPISAEQPSGQKQDAAEIYDQIEQARTADDTLARNQWQRDLKKADWHAVISLATAALTHKVKDLKLAVLLTEALAKQHGLAGMRDGLQLTRELLTQFWDSLYPAIDDGDLEARAIQLEWLNKNLPFSLEQMPLTIAMKGEAYSWQHRQEALKLEGLAQSDTEKAQAARESMINDGKITLEQFEAAVNATPREFYKTLGDELRQSLAQITLLEEVVDQKFGVQEAPSLGKIKKSLDDCLGMVEDILQRKPQPHNIEFDSAPIENKEGAALECEELDNRDLSPSRHEVSPSVPTCREEALQDMGELADFPTSSDAASNDGTLVANPETDDEREPAFRSSQSAVESAAAPAHEEKTDHTWLQAIAHVQAGQIQTGVALLRQELLAARSKRERFLSQLRLAELCLLADKPALAKPIVEELVTTVEQFRLEEWEPAELNVRVWRACHRCYRELGNHNGADHDLTNRAFAKLCQLDLVQALECTDGVME